MAGKKCTEIVLEHLERIYEQTRKAKHMWWESSQVQNVCCSVFCSSLICVLESKQPCIMVTKGKGCSLGLATRYEIQKITGVCFEYIYVIK